MSTFRITSKDPHSFARTGELVLKHGTIKTPIFMPCGTKGTVKTLDTEELEKLNIEIILGNTYHLHLRPGEDLISNMGGLNKWINWKKPILTDSGGFQVFSLGKTNKITDHGVTFQSHLDGSKKTLTPETAIQIQKKLGADIIMAFDECAPGESSKAYAQKAMQRTHKWLKQSYDEFKKDDSGQLLFPIVQGTIFDDLRLESLNFCKQYAENGIAIGGLSVGESKEDMYRILDTLAPELPENIPHYLMGVGTPEDILNGVQRGIDMFDCVLPTRLARHGSYWNHTGRHNIRLEKNKEDSNPLDTHCQCFCCQNHSKSYLRHLFIEKEILALKLLTIHNLHFLVHLIQQIRDSISEGTFIEFKTNFLKDYHY